MSTPNFGSQLANLEAQNRQLLQQLAQREGQAAQQLQSMATNEARNQQMLQQLAQREGQVASTMSTPNTVTASTGGTVVGGISIPQVTIPNIMQQYQGGTMQ
jgi:hypothetical protein